MKIAFETKRRATRWMLRRIWRPFADHRRHLAELARDQHQVRHRARHLGAAALGDREPRLLQRRHVVDPVAEHRRRTRRPRSAPAPRAPCPRGRSARSPAPPAPPRAARRRPRAALAPSSAGPLRLDPEVAGDRPDRRRVVAGEHLERDVLAGEEGDRLGRRSSRSSSARTTIPSGRSGSVSSTSGAGLGQRRGRRTARARTRRPRRPPRRRARSRSVVGPASPSPSSSASGAPSTSRRPPSSSALQRRREENGTVAVGSSGAHPVAAAPPRGSPPGSSCGSGRSPRRCRRCSPARPRSRPSAGISSTTRSAASVSVPVLSVHITETEASDSIAFSCWARIAVAGHLRRRHRRGQRDQQDQPLGDDVDDPRGERLDRVGLADVAERQRHAEPDPERQPSPRPSRSAAGPSPAPAASAGGGRRARSRSAGRRGCRRRPRSPRSRPRPRPRRSRRGPRRRPSRSTGSDSPVSSDSSSASPSARTSVPSAGTWSPLPIRTRSPTTTSSTGTSRGSPSRTTVAFAHHQRRELVERALGPHLLEGPDRDVGDQDAEEERVLGVAEDDRRGPEPGQDHVEDREGVGDEDRPVRPTRPRPRATATLTQPTLRLHLRQPNLGVGLLDDPGHAR